LMAIIGGPDAGKVDWHPSVLEKARKTGLSVDDEGNEAVVRQGRLHSRDYGAAVLGRGRLTWFRVRIR
jgi:hypothetical protein